MYKMQPQHKHTCTKIQCKSNQHFSYLSEVFFCFWLSLIQYFSYIHYHSSQCIGLPSVYQSNRFYCADDFLFLEFYLELMGNLCEGGGGNQLLME